MTWELHGSSPWCSTPRTFKGRLLVLYVWGASCQRSISQFLPSTYVPNWRCPQRRKEEREMEILVRHPQDPQRRSAIARSQSLWTGRHNTIRHSTSICDRRVGESIYGNKMMPRARQRECYGVFQVAGAVAPRPALEEAPAACSIIRRTVGLPSQGKRKHRAHDDGQPRHSRSTRPMGPSAISSSHMFCSPRTGGRQATGSGALKG